MIAFVLQPFSMAPPLAILIEWVVLVVACAVVLTILVVRRIR